MSAFRLRALNVTSQITTLGSPCWFQSFADVRPHVALPFLPGLSALSCLPGPLALPVPPVLPAPSAVPNLLFLLAPVATVGPPLQKRIALMSVAFLLVNFRRGYGGRRAKRFLLLVGWQWLHEHEHDM